MVAWTVGNEGNGCEEPRDGQSAPHSVFGFASAALRSHCVTGGSGSHKVAGRLLIRAYRKGEIYPRPINGYPEVRGRASGCNGGVRADCDCSINEVEIRAISSLIPRAHCIFVR